MNTPSEINARLARERERLFPTEEAFSTRTGLPPGPQWLREDGDMDVDAVYLSTLEQHGFDISYILNGDEEKREEREFLRLYRRAPRNSRRKARELLTSRAA
uniref:Uncharacterized protein n=1 Tax=Candidatus Kentrum sp. TC TaxID=2126339 RepID=A0A450YYJ1_9GAMM|nr:MAG: hypothetical protein BECKTC1821E_GA0114239_10679 [Candidatus Kentron sp. TC]